LFPAAFVCARFGRADRRSHKSDLFLQEASFIIICRQTAVLRQSLLLNDSIEARMDFTSWPGLKFRFSHTFSARTGEFQTVTIQALSAALR
jgi:hypothetical protein